MFSFQFHTHTDTHTRNWRRDLCSLQSKQTVNKDHNFALLNTGAVGSVQSFDLSIHINSECLKLFQYLFSAVSIHQYQLCLVLSLIIHVYTFCCSVCLFLFGVCLFCLPHKFLVFQGLIVFLFIPLSLLLLLFYHLLISLLYLSALYSFLKCIYVWGRILSYSLFSSYFFHVYGILIDNSYFYSLWGWDGRRLVWTWKDFYLMLCWYCLCMLAFPPQTNGNITLNRKLTADNIWAVLCCLWWPVCSGICLFFSPFL